MLLISGQISMMLGRMFVNYERSCELWFKLAPPKHVFYSELRIRAQILTIWEIYDARKTVP